MAKEMHNRFIAQNIEMLTGLMKCGYINAEDSKEYLEWCQQIVAGLYTGYLYCIGESEHMDSQKETLIAQNFIHVMLRGLIDLINTVPDTADDGKRDKLDIALNEALHALNEDFDDEFLPEVDDGK